MYVFLPGFVGLTEKSPVFWSGVEDGFEAQLRTSRSITVPLVFYAGGGMSRWIVHEAAGPIQMKWWWDWVYTRSWLKEEPMRESGYALLQVLVQARYVAAREYALGAEPRSLT